LKKNKKNPTQRDKSSNSYGQHQPKIHSQMCLGFKIKESSNGRGNLQVFFC